MSIVGLMSWHTHFELSLIKFFFLLLLFVIIKNYYYYFIFSASFLLKIYKLKYFFTILYGMKASKKIDFSLALLLDDIDMHYNNDY